MAQKNYFEIFRENYYVMIKDHDKIHPKIEWNDIEGLRKLIQSGANPNAADPFGETVLMSAFYKEF